MFRNIKTVLFDVDDTLFDRRKAQDEIIKLIIKDSDEIFSKLDHKEIHKAFQDSDLIVSRNLDTGRFYGQARIERSRIFLDLLKLNTEYAEKITEVYMDLYPKINIPIKGAKIVIESLKKHFQLGIVSNGYVDIQYHKLEALGIKNHFDCIVLSDEIGIRKPDKKIFLEAAELLNRLPSDCMYVGNSYEYDVAGARKSGMKVCWFNPNGLIIPPMGIKPDLEILTLEEMLPVFMKYV